MNWEDIKVSEDNTHYLHKGAELFNKHFKEVLKFHSPGLAPVLDESGAYHIDTNGKPLYSERYLRTFGFYCNRAAVIRSEEWFHIKSNGERAYSDSFAWIGNFQENLCPVRDYDNNYYHIDLYGSRIYKENHLYSGDYKDGIACIKSSDGFFRHINTKGELINNMMFLDLGVFHKNYATARDQNGWHHIDKSGKELYTQRYSAIEPFYNGFALVTDFQMKKSIIDERGKKILVV